MADRVRGKVLASRRAVDQLHSQGFLSPSFHLKRKNLGETMMSRVERMKELGLGATSPPHLLDDAAF